MMTNQPCRAAHRQRSRGRSGWVCVLAALLVVLLAGCTGVLGVR